MSRGVARYGGASAVELAFGVLSGGLTTLPSLPAARERGGTEDRGSVSGLCPVSRAGDVCILLPNE